jgi:hypothetical protein
MPVFYYVQCLEQLWSIRPLLEVCGQLHVPTVLPLEMPPKRAQLKI